VSSIKQKKALSCSIVLLPRVAVVVINVEIRGIKWSREAAEERL
jgi:hypothetical protein